MSGATFTCITCQVAFADADLQRAHYKTDWHRYNLKRKVASLPHVTAEGFSQRVLAQRAQVCAASYIFQNVHGELDKLLYSCTCINSLIIMYNVHILYVLQIL